MKKKTLYLTISQWSMTGKDYTNVWFKFDSREIRSSNIYYLSKKPYTIFADVSTCYYTKTINASLIAPP